MKILIVCTIALGSVIFLLWVCRRLFIRRIERCYDDLLQLHHMMRRLPEGHMPPISADDAMARVEDYDDVMSSGLYSNDPMLHKLKTQCSWLHNREHFRIMFPS